MSAVAVLLSSAALASAATGYRPARESPRTPILDRDDASDTFDLAPSARPRWSDRVDRQDVLPASERRFPNRASRYGSWDEHSDSFGLGGSRGREKVPRASGRASDADWGQTDPTDRRRPVLSPRPEIPVSPSRNNHVPGPQELISRRYQDPSVQRFMQALSPQQALAMYAETLNLIATRHISPPGPEALVERGVINLLEALQNPAFVQAHRLSTSAQRAAGFEQALSAQMSRMPVRTTQEAVALLQVAMQVAGQHLGVSPAAVALEFEYGALEALDQYSAFVPPESARSFHQQLGESVVGVGIQIEAADDGVRILKVMPEGSAAQAGLQRGDLIVAVDGRRLSGNDLEAATAMITGPEGTLVTLEVSRDGGLRTQVSVPRRRIELRSVTDVQIIHPQSRIGYLKLETFAAGSAKELEQALWTLHQQGMQSLILDLRGDPGGLLTTAVEVANLFLPEGTIVSTRGRTATDNLTETATREQTWKVPLIVLVDEHSASASEILAAAIQENGRGLIVGQRTYGKGSVQTLFPLASVGAGLRLTTALFYSPSGREMAGAGVQPDLPVPATPAAAEGDLRTDGDLRAALEAAQQGRSNAWSDGAAPRKAPLGGPFGR